MMIRLVSYTEGGNQTFFRSDFVSHHQSSIIYSFKYCESVVFTCGRCSSCTGTWLQKPSEPPCPRGSSRSSSCVSSSSRSRAPSPRRWKHPPHQTRLSYRLQRGRFNFNNVLFFLLLIRHFKRFRQNNDNVELTFQCSGK